MGTSDSNCEPRARSLVGQLVVIDGSVEIDPVISRIAKSQNKIARQLTLDVDGPLLAVADFLLAGRSGNALAQQRVESQRAACRLQKALRKGVAQIELRCYTVGQCRQRGSDRGEPTRTRDKVVERRCVEDPGAAANDRFIVGAICETEARIEVGGL